MLLSLFGKKHRQATHRSRSFHSRAAAAAVWALPTGNISTKTNLVSNPHSNAKAAAAAARDQRERERRVACLCGLRFFFLHRARDIADTHHPRQKSKKEYHKPKTKHTKTELSKADGGYWE